MKQGSVLSPVLFLLIMDPLLTQFQGSGLGRSSNNFYAGGFLHADDIRTLATSLSPETLEAQVSMEVRTGYYQKHAWQSWSPVLEEW